MTTSKQQRAITLQKIASLMDHIHDALRITDDDGEAIETVTLKLPRAWLFLAAAMQVMERQIAGQKYPDPTDVIGLNDRILRRLARRWLQSEANFRMRLHFEYLCNGGHPLLQSLHNEDELNDALPIDIDEEELPF